MRRSSRRFIAAHLTNGLALWLVVVAFVTMPVCAHPAAPEMYAGEDVRTITEQRDVTERFTTPGAYILHAPEAPQNGCESCDAPGTVRSDLDPAPTDTMQDFFHRDAASSGEGVAMVMPPLSSPHDASSPARHGRTIGVEPPPPEACATLEHCR